MEQHFRSNYRHSNINEIPGIFRICNALLKMNSGSLRRIGNSCTNCVLLCEFCLKFKTEMKLFLH